MFTVDSLFIEDTRLCLLSSSKGLPRSTVQLPYITLGPLSTTCQNNHILSALSRESSQYLVIFNGWYLCPIMIITNHLYFFQVLSYFLILDLVLMEFRWASSLILSIHFTLVLHTHTQTRIYTYKEHVYKIIQVP